MVAKLQISGIDISVYSYNRIEKVTQNPTVSLLYACCKILDCDMNAILIFLLLNFIPPKFPLTVSSGWASLKKYTVIVFPDYYLHLLHEKQCEMA